MGMLDPSRCCARAEARQAESFATGPLPTGSPLAGSARWDQPRVISRGMVARAYTHSCRRTRSTRPPGRSIPAECVAIVATTYAGSRDAPAVGSTITLRSVGRGSVTDHSSGLGGRSGRLGSMPARRSSEIIASRARVMPAGAAAGRWSLWPAVAQHVPQMTGGVPGDGLPKWHHARKLGDHKEADQPGNQRANRRRSMHSDPGTLDSAR